MKKLFILLCSFCMLLTLFACSKSNGQYTAGTYEGKAMGFGGDVVVTVTVDNEKIKEVVLVGDGETESVGKAALSTLSDQIIKAQSSDIDGVVGATVTTTAVKEALDKALASARGEVTETVLTDGTYSATKDGFQEGYETVEVTVKDGKIADVKVVESTDFPVTLTAAPVKEIPAAIVENQSYNVDCVTGATFTSNAIKNAVKDCLDQAGGSEAFSSAVVKEKIEKEDINTDILVVGAGGAGMMAALEASCNDDLSESSGLSVTLIEKAGFVGGITALSGGVRYFYDDETGAYDEAWANECLEKEKAALQASMELEFNEEFMRNEILVNPIANKIMADMGVKDEDAWGYRQFIPSDDYVDPKWRGAYFAYVAGPYIQNNTDIDLRLNTAATKLVTDESGAVIGAEVEDKEGTYTIYAKKVILATGGFAQNLDLIEKYAPEFTEGIVFSSGTNDGDGIVMLEELNAQIIGDKMMGHVGADSNLGARPDFGAAVYYGWNTHPFVNMNGERFTNEGKSKYQIYHDILSQPDLTCWGILGSDDSFVPALESSTSEYVYKADSLEELADKLGIPSDKLVETVNEWNKMVEAGVDEKFGLDASHMAPVGEGPYYAYILRPITMTSEVAPKVDGYGRVINQDGEVIKNVFAAGDMVMGGNVSSYYFDARGTGTAFYSGTLCAKTAREEILAGE